MSATDIGGIAVICFVSAIVFFVLAFVGIQIYDAMAVNSAFSSNADVMAVINASENTTYKLDWVFFGLFIGLMLGLIITGWFIQGNPLFVFIYFIVICIFTIISFALSNAWETMSTQLVFNGLVSHFPITDYIMLQLPYIMVVVGLIGVVVIFAKPNAENSSAGGSL